MIFRFSILSLFLVILIDLNFAFSADYARGVDASLRGDFTTAMKEWKPLAKLGGASSQFQVGWLYDEGKGVAQNHMTAIKWYRLAAEQGYAYAQSALARMYKEGRGVPQDYTYAYMWLSIANSKWYPDAKQIRDKVIKKLTNTQLQLAQKLVRECVQKKYKGC